jgi:hypothetical protein
MLCTVSKVTGVRLLSCLTPARRHKDTLDVLEDAVT